jgi:hypothetical protein
MCTFCLYTVDSLIIELTYPMEHLKIKRTRDTARAAKKAFYSYFMMLFRDGGNNQLISNSGRLTGFYRKR